MIWTARLRAAGLGVLSGIIAGVVAGVIARIDMRIVAVAAGMKPVFTLGSLNPVWIGAVTGAAFGLIFIFVKPYLPGSHWFKGLIFGLLLFLAFMLPLYVWQPDFRAELALAPGYLGIALFGPLPLIFGALVGLAAQRLDRRLPAVLPPGSTARAGFVALLIVGVVGAGMVVYGVIAAIVEAGR